MGWLADIYGRKTILYPSFLIMLASSLLATVMPNIWLFLACRFIAGISEPGIFGCIFLIMSETVSTRFRPLATNIDWLDFRFLSLVITSILHYKLENIIYCVHSELCPVS